MSEIVPSEGAYAYGGYPDIDVLYRQQGFETDRRKREAPLHQIQQLLHERVRFGPIWEYIWPSGIGPRVEEPALMLINPYPGRRRWKRCGSRSETGGIGFRQRTRANIMQGSSAVSVDEWR